MPDSTVIAQIAGRDSVAAAVLAVRERGFARVVPTIAYSGTETGDQGAPARAVERLRELLLGMATVDEPITLHDPKLWAALNGRPAAELRERFGVFSPCMACHLYFHLLRVPLSWSLGNAPVVSGERDTHDGRVKLSQTTASIDASIRVMAYADVELLEPLRAMSGQQVGELVGDGGDEGAGQLSCLLSGNYATLDGRVPVQEAAYERYISEFFEPVGRAVIDAWRSPGDGSAGYGELVAEVLSLRD